MYIVIVGGGNVGYYLAKTLSTTSHEVLLMEKDRQVHRMIAEELGEIAVQGDGCEVRLLEEAGVGRADVVVAATGDDEDNLVICQMSKRMFNVPRTIARVNNPLNEDLFHRFGIDATVSSTKIIYNLIEQEIQTGQVTPLAALKRGRLEIVDIEISENSASPPSLSSTTERSGSASSSSRVVTCSLIAHPARTGRRPHRPRPTTPHGWPRPGIESTSGDTSASGRRSPRNAHGGLGVALSDCGGLGALRPGCRPSVPAG